MSYPDTHYRNIYDQNSIDPIYNLYTLTYSDQCTTDKKDDTNHNDLGYLCTS